MAYQNKAMVLGTNYYIGLSLVRGLGKMGVPVVAVNYSKDNEYGQSKYVTEELMVAHYKTHPKELCKALIEYAKKQDEKTVLFQTADAYAQFVDDFHDELKPYFLFPSDQKGLVSDLVDKYTMVEYTDKYGVKTPEMIAADVEDLTNRVEQEIGYPCIIKPKDSATFIRLYRNKVFFINNEKELLEKVARCKKDDVEVFVQRIIPGPETNCYCWEGYLNQESKCTHYTTVQKMRQWPNNFGAATYAKQKWIPECHEICAPFFEQVGYKGFVEVDLKKDENTGDIYVIEANCRYIGFTELLIAIGFNTPFITYREMIGDPLPPKAWDYDTGYSWIHALEDKFARDMYAKTGQMTREEMRQDTQEAGIKVTPIWSKQDPKPAITYTLYSGKKVLRRIKKIFTGKKTS